MAIPTSQRKTDGGRIPGPAACPNVVEFQCAVQLPNLKLSHFAFQGHYTAPPTDLQSLANSAMTTVGASWGTNIGPHSPVSTIFEAVHVRDMTSPANPIFISSGAAVPGTGTAPAMPADTAIVLTENVAARGRGLKGRMYLGGWDQSADSGGGMISAAAQTAANAFGTAIFNFLTTNNLTPCVAQVGRREYIGLTGTHHNARGASFVPVQNYTVLNNEWDTQRRRGQ